MEDESYAHAYRKALDLYAVGQPLAEHLPLADERFGLDGWRDKKPENSCTALSGLFLPSRPRRWPPTIGWISRVFAVQHAHDN